MINVHEFVHSRDNESLIRNDGRRVCYDFD